MGSPETALLVFAGLLLLALVLGIVSWRRRRGHGSHDPYGAEYDDVLEESGSVTSAGRELRQREARAVQSHRFHVLSDAEREHFAARWSAIQARFVADPIGAVHDADELVRALMRALGYPVHDFSHRLDDLSADFPEVVQHYRAARVLIENNPAGDADTEELRQAVVHYRALFGEVLVRSSAPAFELREVHA